MEDKYYALLDSLQDGVSVAVVYLLGSLCPITLGHVQAIVESRKILLGGASSPVRRPSRLEHFTEVLGFIDLNGGEYVSAKLKSKGESSVGCDVSTRSELVQTACADIPWLSYRTYKGDLLAQLRARWPRLRFVWYTLNGADDVLRYGKFRCHDDNRYIVIGRPGSTQGVLDGLQKNQVDLESGWYIVGPELADISSTAAREAARRGDAAALVPLLHPGVAARFLAIYGPKAGSGGSVVISSGGTLSSSILSRQPAVGASSAPAYAPVSSPPETPSFIARVRRRDATPSTLLRRIPTTDRNSAVFVEPPIAVLDGEAVTVLRLHAVGPAAGFAWVRAQSGGEGYVNAIYIDFP